MDQEILLTSEQEQKLLNFWNLQPSNPPGLKALTNHVFEGSFDGRSQQGRAIKQALSKLNLRAKVTSEYEPKTEIILTDEQKAYIINNSSTMNSLEIAKELFKNPSLTNLNAETRAVNIFRKTLDTRVVYQAEKDKDIPVGLYEAPDTLDKVLRRVNKYVNCSLSKDALTAQQKKNLEKLISYLHTYRFIKQMNIFEENGDRSLCEDAFIRHTYDKPDLEQEEVDQYIELANQIVQGFKVQRRKEKLEMEAEHTLDANIDNPEEKAKLSMGLVEAIGKASTEYHQCIARQQKLLDVLKVKRSERLDKQVSESSSLLNWIQLWRFEEERIGLIKLAEYEQQNVANEVERLTSVAELKCRILGLDKEGVLNG